MLKAFIIVLLGLVLMTGGIQFKSKSSDKWAWGRRRRCHIWQYANISDHKAVEHWNTRTPTAILTIISWFVQCSQFNCFGIKSGHKMWTICLHVWFDIGLDGCSPSLIGIRHGLNFPQNSSAIWCYICDFWGSILPHWDATSVRVCRGPVECICNGKLHFGCPTTNVRLVSTPNMANHSYVTKRPASGSTYTSPRPYHSTTTIA
jgi:hypothetical protein